MESLEIRPDETTRVVIQGKGSRFGAFLDPVADKVLVAGALLALAFAPVHVLAVRFSDRIGKWAP